MSNSIVISHINSRKLLNKSSAMIHLEMILEARNLRAVNGHQKHQISKIVVARVSASRECVQLRIYLKKES